MVRNSHFRMPAMSVQIWRRTRYMFTLGNMRPCVYQVISARLNYRVSCSPQEFWHTPYLWHEFPPKQNENNKDKFRFSMIDSVYLTCTGQNVTKCCVKALLKVLNQWYDITFLWLFISLLVCDFVFFEACLKLIPLSPRQLSRYPRVLYTKQNLRPPTLIP